MSVQTMRALQVDTPNAALKHIELPLPNAGSGEVVVKIRASGVNPLDIKIRAGSAAHAQHPFPAILGMDLAGEVHQVGEGVRNFSVGDRVWAMAGGVGGVQGSMAEYASVDARLLAKMPRNLSMRQAAAMPLVAITAWEGIVDIANVKAGDKVLVIGAAGGVGHMALQLAKARGAETYGLDSADSAGYLRSIGATPINRETPVSHFAEQYTSGKGFDVVYDCVGSLDTAFQAVRTFGTVTSSLGWGTHSLAPLSFRSARYAGVFTLRPLLTGQGREAHGNILSEVTKLVEAGKVSPRLDDHPFWLHDADTAHEWVRSGQANGKVVITVSE
ncbi:zinc-dependent alcohol dehydrogenase family protein [Rhodoferax sp. GW822-FHT02A01]|uniref:zinc-dependent alcohol dehydrogenase family protein n=1 Tax=Rhodoferax sp. GW822-FHT02A01 TaxID=3141537 RepID=UPI00315D87E9